MSGREAVHIPESWLSRLYRLWWLSILPSDAPSMFTTARFTSERFGSRVRPEESCPANMCAVADSAYLTALVAARQGLPESRPTILYCNVQVVDVWTFCSSHNGTYVAQCWDPPAVGSHITERVKRNTSLIHGAIWSASTGGQRRTNPGHTLVWYCRMRLVSLSCLHAERRVRS
jgi:hypothetical protein